MALGVGKTRLKLSQARATEHRLRFNRDSLACFTAPSENLLRANLPAPGYFGYLRTQLQCLGDNPPLLLRRPAPPTSWAGQDLDAPKPALRVVINVVHNDSSKTSASSHISMFKPHR
jgi:hypothetical protein